MSTRGEFLSDAGPTLLDGTPVTSRTQVADYLEQVYLRFNRRVGARCAEQYRLAVRKLSRFQRLRRAAEGQPLTGLCLGDLSRELISDAMDWSIASEKNGNRTANNLLRNVRPIWRRALDDGIEGVHPCRKIDEYRQPRPLSSRHDVDTLSRLVRAAQTESGTIGETSARVFWCGLLMFLYSTALRPSAAMRLPSSTIDFATRRVRVPPEVQKNDVGHLVWIKKQSMWAIRELALSDPENAASPLRGTHLFGDWTHSIATLRDHLKRLLRRAGLPQGRRDLLYKIRRTTGYFCERAEGPDRAALYLGHVTKLAVTRHYVTVEQALELIPDVDLWLPDLDVEIQHTLKFRIVG